MSTRQPGWYPDPAGGPMLLWWDGTNWLYRAIEIEADSSGMTASELARSRDDRFNRKMRDAQRTVQELVDQGVMPRDTPLLRPLHLVRSPGAEGEPGLTPRVTETRRTRLDTNPWVWGRLALFGVFLVAIAPFMFSDYQDTSRAGRGWVMLVVGIPIGLWLIAAGLGGLYATVRGIPDPAPWWGRQVLKLAKR